MQRKYTLFTVMFLISLGLDQWTKIWARHNLKPLTSAMVIVPNYFDLRYAENPGIAFSLLRDVSNGRYLLAGFGVIALILMLFWLKKLPGEARILAIALGLIAGGALGNLIDRFWVGRVTDFIVWKVGTHEWPTFNIADATLVIGIGLAFLFDPGQKKAKKAA